MGWAVWEKGTAYALAWCPEKAPTDLFATAYAEAWAKRNPQYPCDIVVAPCALNGTLVTHGDLVGSPWASLEYPRP